MKTINKVFIILWVIILLDSSGAVFCKLMDFCVNNSLVHKIINAKHLPINNNWVYVYLFLAILGLITAIICSKK